MTSVTGAAIRDVLSVIARRAPHIPVRVYPTAVQGEAAAGEIRAALARVHASGDCDVVLMVRGGGSLEDLWCFNDEGLARDLAEFPLPVVTGVGHEIDFTIVDFVADLRAPTPSVAAESITPDRNELMLGIDDRVARLQHRLAARLQQARERLGYLARALEQQHPARQMAQARERLDQVRTRLLRGQQLRLGDWRHRLQLCRSQLWQGDPRRGIERQRERLAHLLADHRAAMRRQLLVARHQLSLQSRALDALSPLKTLARGFATVSKDDRLVTSASQLASDDEIRIRFADGDTDAVVK